MHREDSVHLRAVPHLRLRLAVATYKWDRTQIRLTGTGEGRRLVRKVLDEVAIMAKGEVSTGTYSTGALAASIQVDPPRIFSRTVSGSVGSRLNYAIVVHEGAKIHPIFPKSARGRYRFGSRKRPQLRFFWLKRGKTVTLPHIPGSPGKMGISHPGMRGKEYLVRPLQIVGARYNMVVIDLS